MVFGKHINKYYVKYGWMLFFGLLSLIMVDYFILKVPEFYRMVVNGINEGRVMIRGEYRSFDINLLLDEVCRPLIIVIIMVMAGRLLWRVCFFGSAIFVETDIRDEMFDKCKDLSQNFYHSNKIGDLMSKFTNDVDTMQECFGDGAMMFCDCMIQGGLSFYKMLRMNTVLAMLSLIPIGLLLFSGFTVGKYMSKKWDERQAVFSKLSDFSQESFSGLSVIKAFAKETLELMAFKKLNKENEKVNVEFVRLSTLLDISVVLFVQSMVAVILGYGGYLVYTGVFNAGEMVEFIGYFTSIVWPVTSVAMQIDMHARGKASLERIGQLLDEEMEVTDKEDVLQDMVIKGGIEFRNLDFTYPGAESLALKNISFKINPGEKIGIIGPTGCGKTTIVDLIARIYNVKDNSLLIDGVCVNRIPIKKLRSHIAYVPQDNFLFSDTIAANIGFSINDLPVNEHEGKDAKKRSHFDEGHMENIKEAAKLAGISGDIEGFTQGYNTVLGERGVTVSGGQKQRLSIARALIRDAEILILDDSVSAVDTKTEKGIIENLRNKRRDKTTIIIAHRISTVQEMDKILLMDFGKIRAFGTHRELMQVEEYRQMVENQRLEEEKKPEEDGNCELVAGNL